MRTEAAKALGKAQEDEAEGDVEVFVGSHLSTIQLIQFINDDNSSPFFRRTRPVLPVGPGSTWAIALTEPAKEVAAVSSIR